MNTEIDFINGDTQKCLLKMTIPMIAALFLNLLYNLVDSLWVGNLLGESAVAALSTITPIVLLLTSIGMGFSNGVSILVSQAVGKKDKSSNIVISTSCITIVMLAIVLSIIIENGIGSILNALNTQPEVYKMAHEYLEIYLIGIVASFMYCYITAVLRSFGNAIFQLIAMIVSTVLNAILDPIFIHIIGFKGAAIATVLAQVLCLIFMIIYLFKKKLFKVSFSSFKGKMVGTVLGKAIPSIIQQSIPAISSSFLTSLVNHFGVSAIAGYGIAGKLEAILFYPAMALNMVLTIIVGQCIGAKKINRAKDYLKCALKFGSGVMLILSVIVIALARVLSGLFLDSASVADVVAHYFIMVNIGYVMYTITSCMLGALNGLGKPVTSMILMIIYYIVIRMPLAYVLADTTLGLSGIWGAILVSHVIAGIAALLTGVVYFKKIEKSVIHNE